MIYKATKKLTFQCHKVASEKCQKHPELWGRERFVQLLISGLQDNRSSRKLARKPDYHRKEKEHGVHLSNAQGRCGFCGRGAL